MKVYADTFLGEELLTWLFEHEGITDRKVATDLAQALLDGELIIDPTNLFQKDTLSGVFSKSVPYKLKEFKHLDAANYIEEDCEDSPEDVMETDDLAPEWVQNLEHQKKAAGLPREPGIDLKQKLHTEKTSSSSPANHKDLTLFLKDFSAIEHQSEIPSPMLDEVFSRHHDYYLDQLLEIEKLDKAKWASFIKVHSDRLLSEVDLEPAASSVQFLMDIRDLVKFKCISSGEQSDSRIVRGEVFTNRVIRTDMPMSATNVKLLLVEESISYHRPEKFVSIEHLHLVEEEFVKNICKKITSLSPDLILVGENIVRKAQDQLANAGISVIQNVKKKNLQRISRLFNAEVLTSLSNVVNIPKLGTCEKFRSVYYEHQDKHLVYLEDSQRPNQWGCCFLLRGGSRTELAKVKRVMKQFLLLKTHATFEKSFLLDESCQVENFIVPDYKSSHISRLSLSPFIELPLPDNDLVKQIDDDCKAQALTQVEHESEWRELNQAKIEPLVLTTTYRTDVRVRNLLADLRAAPVQVRSSNRPQNPTLPPAPRLYSILNRSLPVSFSSYLSNPDGEGSRYCVKPWVSAMKCYRDNDLPLGLFLFSYCFDKNVRCLSTQDMPSTGMSSASLAPSSKNSPCQISIVNHGRRFCLDGTSVTLIVQDLKGSVTDPKNEDQIVMWKFCPDCQTMTDLLPMSKSACKMSYGMFLLLLIKETKLVRRKFVSCTHSLHNFQYTCFGHRNQIAFFKMQTITPHEVKMPPEMVRLPDNFPVAKELRDDLSKLSVLGSGVHGQLHEKLVQLQNECDNFGSAGLASEVRKLVSDQQAGFEASKVKIDMIGMNIEASRDLIKAQSDILMLQVAIMKDVTNWRLRISKFFEQKKKEDKLMAKSGPKSRVASGSSLLLPPEEQQHMSLPALSTANTDSGSNLRSREDDPTPAKSKKGSSGNVLSFITEQDFGTLDSPFPSTLHPDLYLKPYIMVDEGQPSSVIAFALGSTEHAEFLFSGDSRKSFDYQFTDNGGSDKFFVKVHFATEFHSFRKKIFDSGHDHQDFLASLAKCDPWQSSGGKSGASFYKTADGRFLLKQINKHEMDTFKNVAHKYFEYITQSDQRSVMAKIVGLYTVGYKTANGGCRLELIILENLFHKHRISESFDLKGSMRNRFVDSTGDKLQGKELVLMDENFQRVACERPFYVTNKTKTSLKRALERDAKFLCDIKVMDYSLLVGKDEITNELVVGIIDYLRPFSIDKIIESQVKKTSGYFQGTAEDPTVISPSAYQTRFIAAMDNYFVLLPDYWYDPPQAPNQMGLV